MCVGVVMTLHCFGVIYEVKQTNSHAYHATLCVCVCLCVCMGVEGKTICRVAGSYYTDKHTSAYQRVYNVKMVHTWTHYFIVMFIWRVAVKCIIIRMILIKDQTITNY